MWAEQTRSWRVLEPWEYKVEMSDREMISRHLFSWQTFWSSRSVWRKQWLWKAFHLAFSNSMSGKMILELARWYIEARANQSSIFTVRMSYSGPLTCRWFLSWWEEWTEKMGFGPDGGFDLPTLQTEIREIIINLIDSAMGQTQGYDSEIHQSICSGKPFSVPISTSCSHFLHRHKAKPRPERHWLHQEWISYYFPMLSSTHELVRGSQLLRRFKDKSSRWMRTNEIEALKGWKDTCSVWTQKTPHVLTQWNPWNHHQFDNLVDSALWQTQRCYSERHQDLPEKVLGAVSSDLAASDDKICF